MVDYVQLLCVSVIWHQFGHCSWLFYISGNEEQTAQQVQDIETEQDGS